MKSSPSQAGSSQLSQSGGRVLGTGKREREDAVPREQLSTQQLQEKDDAEREETPPPQELDEVCALTSTSHQQAK